MAIEALIIGLTLGALFGWIAAEILLAQPARAERDALRSLTQKRLRNDLHTAIERVEWRAKHAGTPYRTETVAAASPGLRIVNGEPMYSAAWLNEEADH